MCKVTFLTAGDEVPHFTFSQKASNLEIPGQRSSLWATSLLLGHTPTKDNHPDLSDMLKFESEKHNDILTWNYGDTLSNLSLKEVLFLRWVGTSCPDTEFLSRAMMMFVWTLLTSWITWTAYPSTKPKIYLQVMWSTMVPLIKSRN